MLKKIGSFLMCMSMICVLCLSLSAHDVVLKLSSCAGERITSQSYDQPLLLTVLVQRDGSEKEPEIAGLQHFNIIARQQAVQEINTNGAVTKLHIYQYTLLAYSLGEFELSVPGYSLRVSITPAVPSRDQVTCSMTCDAHEVYAGEYVSCVITCDYDQRTVALQKLLCPESEFVACRAEQPHIITYSSEGQSREKRTWLCYLCVNKPGEIIVPGACCYYIVESRNDNFFWGWSYAQQREGYIRSHPSTMIVKALPCTTKQVCAIGQITKAQLTLSAPAVKRGEGVTATLTFSGSGNLDVLPKFQLTVPAGMRAYSSGSKKEGSIQSGTKTYEYVLHPQEAGNFVLPSQEITFFDTQKKQYRTIRTNSVTLTIQAVKQVATKFSDEQEQKQSSDSCFAENYAQASLPIKKTIPWKMIIKIGMYFIILMVCVWGGIKGYCSGYKSLRSRKNSVYKRAFKKLGLIRTHKTLKDLAPLFYELFRERTGLSDEEARNYVDNFLKKTPGRYECWLLFEARMLSYTTYAPYEQRDISCERLLEDAREWLEYFKICL